MIVSAMTPDEVYREMELDMPEVSRWWLRQREVLIKRALKMMKFPMNVWYEYKSKRHNRWLVLAMIMGRKYNNTGMTAVVALQKWERGYAIYYTRWPWQVAADRMVIQPHVFDRYGERMKVGKTGIELIKHYIERSPHGESTDNSRFSGRSVRYGGRDNVCLSIRDGVLLGENVNGIFVAHTFITYDMAGGLQKEEFEKNKSKLRSNEQMLKEIRELMNYLKQKKQ